MVLLKIYSSINKDRSNNGAIRFIAQDPGMYVSYKAYSYICPTDIFGINFKIATEYYRCYISQLSEIQCKLCHRGGRYVCTSAAHQVIHEHLINLHRSF